MIDLAIAGVFAALDGLDPDWPVYSGTVAPAVRPPYLRIGEASLVPNRTMGNAGADVMVPIHAYAAGRSVVAPAAILGEVVAALEVPGAVTVTGRTVNVLHESTDDVGPEIEGGGTVQHLESRFRVWIR